MPLNVIVAVAPEQIVVVPEMVTVGKAFTVTTAFPDKFWEQIDAPDEAILTKVYVLLAVKAGVIILAFPVASSGIVRFPPELIV